MEISRNKHSRRIWYSKSQGGTFGSSCILNIFRFGRFGENGQQTLHEVLRFDVSHKLKVKVLKGGNLKEGVATPTNVRMNIEVFPRAG